MNIGKKFDRAFQWAGEKLGSEAKTTMTDDFKTLETEMALRFDGMDRLQKATSAYVRWLSRRGEAADDREKSLPIAYLARTMMAHGEDFDPDSELGNALIAMGRTNDRLSVFHDAYIADATVTWLDSLERSLAMMKEYQSARKKLENRRLAFDASTTKAQKAKRDDYRLEDDLRSARAKYGESSDDVLRRIQDVKDAEVDTVRDLSRFLDVELEYHEQCADELRRLRQTWAGAAGTESPAHGADQRPRCRSRASTVYSTASRSNRSDMHDDPPDAPLTRIASAMPVRSASRMSTASSVMAASIPDVPVRPVQQRMSTVPVQRPAVERLPSVGGGATYDVSSLRGQLRPLTSRMSYAGPQDDVFADAGDDSSSGGSASPGVNLDGLGRSASTIGRRAPPPPPSRARKPPPPVPAKKRQSMVY